MKLIQVYNHLKFDRIVFSQVNSLTWLLHIEGEDILKYSESVVNNVGCCRRLLKFGVRLGLGFTGGRVEFLHKLNN